MSRVKVNIMRAAMTLLLGVFTLTAGATDISTITVNGVEYSLLSGFTVYAGHGGGTYSYLVDGDNNTYWDTAALSGIDEAYEVQFRPDDDIAAVIPKGYILANGANQNAGWSLAARLGDTGLWHNLSVWATALVGVNTYNIACDNSDNRAFNRFFFKFNGDPYISELRIYGLYYTHLTAKAATCTETGILRECYYRSDGKYFTDLTGETELSASDVIAPMIPHTGVHGVFPNNIEYWQCSVCGKYFSDAGCTEEIIPLTSGTTSWTQGRYIVIEDVTIPSRITVSGGVILTLCDNTTLTTSKGICVSSGSTLQIDGFSTDEQTMGTLIARTQAENAVDAAIGGNYDKAAGTIIITGGRVEARATYGAGIGGSGFGQPGDIYLKGGVIIASSDNGSGIGSGSQSEGSATVNIYDGIRRIEAASAKGMAIGNGYNPKSGTVTVNFYNGSTAVTGTNKDAIFYDTGEGTSRVIRTKACNHSIYIGNNLQAHITPNTPLAIKGETVTLTLDYAVDEATLTVSDGTNNLTLTDKGNRQYSFVMPDGDITVTATILVPHNITIGTDLQAHVTASAASALRGETITLTLDALVYETTLTISDGTNNLTMTDEGNRQYSFVMPDGDVTVTATLFTADLRDGVAYDRTSDFVVATATYTKTLGTERVGKHQAWMVPFDYTITAADEDKFTFYKINMIANSPSPSVEASDEMWVFLTKLNAGDVLHGNMPYVYKPKEAVTDYEFTTTPATLKAKNADVVLKTETTEEVYSFYGTYENTTATTSDPFYYIGIDGNVSYGDAVTVGPYRWILRKSNKFGSISAYARKMQFFDPEEDDVTYIENREQRIENNEQWYDLSGRKLSQKPSQSGVYIVNGRKVNVK